MPPVTEAAAAAHVDGTLMIEARNSEHSRQAVTEPVSPELVLVDPQLATVARKRLRAAGERPRSARRDAARDQRADPRAAHHAYGNRVAGELGASAIAQEGVDGHSSFKSRRRGLVMATAALAVVAAAAAVVSIRLRDVEAAGGSLPTSIQTASAPKAAEARQDQPASKPLRARRGTASTRSSKPIVQPKKRLLPARPAPLPTRVFVWPAVSRATFYKVEFFRSGRKIFEAAPTTPRLELPLRWRYRGRAVRLTPGTYRWDVRPAFGTRSRPRYGTLITRSNWIAR
jgi:hypothetical protein